MRIEKIFEVPPLRWQSITGGRPSYLYYVSDTDWPSLEGVGRTPQAALLDLRATKHRLRTRSWKSL